MLGGVSDAWGWQDDVDNLRELAHPNLCHFFGLDHYMDNDTLMIHLIMEHVGGGSLRTKIQQFSSLSAEVSVLAM
jgi:serine/threonine protein kinase